METKSGKTRKLNERTFDKALSAMFKNIKSGNLIYIVFSKRSFHILIFTLSMSIIANIIIAYLIVNSLPLTMGIGALTNIVMLILSFTTIISGLWLVFKGIDIVTDDADLK